MNKYQIKDFFILDVFLRIKYSLTTPLLQARDLWWAIREFADGGKPFVRKKLQYVEFKEDYVWTTMQKRAYNKSREIRLYSIK